MISRLLSQARLLVVIQIAAGVAALLVWIAPVPKLKLSSLETPPLPSLPNLSVTGAVPNMQQLIARPLFAQTRRPPPPVVTPPPASVVALPKPVPTTNGMVLLGILHDGTKAIALVTLPGDTLPMQVASGAVLGAWVVKKISSDRLFLASGDTNAQLVLPQPSPPSNAPGTVGYTPPPTFPYLRAQ